MNIFHMSFRIELNKCTGQVPLRDRSCQNGCDVTKLSTSQNSNLSKLCRAPSNSANHFYSSKETTQFLKASKKTKLLFLPKCLIEAFSINHYDQPEMH